MSTSTIRMGSAVAHGGGTHAGFKFKSSLKIAVEKMPRAARARIEKAMQKTGEELVKTARTVAPVDTGELRDSIRWSAIKSKENITIKVVAGEPTKQGAVGAMVQEFGRQDGSIVGRKYMQYARSFHATRHRRRINTAISLAVKESLGASR